MNKRQATLLFLVVIILEIISVVKRWNSTAEVKVPGVFYQMDCMVKCPQLNSMPRLSVYDAGLSIIGANI
jgi:hypothetical protein